MADVTGVTSTDSPSEGIVENTDVNAASSTAQGVIPGSPTGDRTNEQMFREMQRRDQERQKQLDQVLAYLVSGQQQRQAPVAERKAPATDEELWALAQQGDRPAYEEYHRRIARNEINQNSQISRNAQVVNGQLNALVNKYPVLNNPQHPLAQTTQQAYQLLLQNGYPAGPATLLDAAKTAIAERPDLIAEQYSQTAGAREQSRQDGTRRASSGQMGGTRQDAPRTQTTKVTPEQQALANRMGVKDPAGAMTRFRKRQEDKLSSFGGVAAFIPEEDA